MPFGIMAPRTLQRVLMDMLRGVILGLAVLGSSCGQGSPPAKTPEVQPVDLHGKLLDEDGAPVAGTAVMLDLGRQRFDLRDGQSVWMAAAHRVIRSSADGSFAFTGIPGDARVHLVSLGLSEDRGPTGWTERACVLRGAAREMSRQTIELRLRIPDRSATGEIVAPDPTIQVGAESGDGWILSHGRLENGSGRFTLEGLMPGEARLLFNYGNFSLESREMKVPLGQHLDLGRLELPRSHAQTAAHPELNVSLIRLVDKEGKPLSGYRFTFSTPAADAQGGTDDNGELRLKGGGLYIGEPPFRMYLDDIERVSDEKRFFGTASERGDTATITVSPMTRVRLSFQRAASPVRDLVVLAKGREPSTWASLEQKDAEFEGWLPPGRCRVHLGTVQGTLVEKELDVPTADEYAVTIDLP
jgi:hypothetical protein